MRLSPVMTALTYEPGTYLERYTPSSFTAHGTTLRDRMTCRAIEWLVEGSGEGVTYSRASPAMAIFPTSPSSVTVPS